jgi:deoxyribodipyrimidine photolyase
VSHDKLIGLGWNLTDVPVIHWFRRDLRLSDNLALREALKTGQPVIPLFILDPAILKGERFGCRVCRSCSKGWQRWMNRCANTELGC